MTIKIRKKGMGKISDKNDKKLKKVYGEGKLDDAWKKLGSLIAPDLKGEEKENVDLNARIANEAYDDLNKRKDEIKGYNYQANMSNKKRAVYYHPEKDEYIVGYRGTKLTDREDLENDARVVFDRLHESDRHKQEDEFIDELKKEGKVRITGHSLGSNHGKLLARKHKVPFVGFQEGEPPHPKKIIRNIKDFFNPKIKNYSTTNDPISFLNPFARRIKPKKGIKNPHTIKHFFGGNKQLAELYNKLLNDPRVLERLNLMTSTGLPPPQIPPVPVYNLYWDEEFPKTATAKYLELINNPANLERYKTPLETELEQIERTPEESREIYVRFLEALSQLKSITRRLLLSSVSLGRDAESPIILNYLNKNNIADKRDAKDFIGEIVNAFNENPSQDIASQMKNNIDEFLKNLQSLPNNQKQALFNFINFNRLNNPFRVQQDNREEIARLQNQIQREDIADYVNFNDLFDSKTFNRNYKSIIRNILDNYREVMSDEVENSMSDNFKNFSKSRDRLLRNYETARTLDDRKLILNEWVAQKEAFQSFIEFIVSRLQEILRLEPRTPSAETPSFVSTLSSESRALPPMMTPVRMGTPSTVRSGFIPIRPASQGTIGFMTPEEPEEGGAPPPPPEMPPLESLEGSTVPRGSLPPAGITPPPSPPVERPEPREASVQQRIRRLERVQRKRQRLERALREAQEDLRKLNREDTRRKEGETKRNYEKRLRDLQAAKNRKRFDINDIRDEIEELERRASEL